VSNDESKLRRYADVLYELGYYSNAINMRKIIDGLYKSEPDYLGSNQAPFTAFPKETVDKWPKHNQERMNVKLYKRNTI